MYANPLLEFVPLRNLGAVRSLCGPASRKSDVSDVRNRRRLPTSVDVPGLLIYSLVMRLQTRMNVLRSFTSMMGLRKAAVLALGEMVFCCLLLACGEANKAY